MKHRYAEEEAMGEEGTERGDHPYLSLFAIMACHLTCCYADFVWMHSKATDKHVCLSVNS